MATNTTKTQIPDEVNNFYDRTLLERLLPLLQFTRFAQVRDLPKKPGTNTIKFRKYNTLAVASTALTEGTTPAGKQLSVSDITADVLQYGDFVQITDVVTYETMDPILTETAEVLGEQAAETLDELARNVLQAGTTVQYSGQGTKGVSGEVPGARASVDTDDLIAVAEIRKAVRTLQTNKAKKITRIVNPDTGYNTSPINAAFIGIIHPKGLYDLKDETGWVPVEKYANKADIIDGEAGALDEVRFILSQKAPVFTSGGSGSIDVYGTIILGANAYGISRISGQALRNIVKPLGSAGSADPLEQRLTSGWKATFITKILDEAAMLRLEHAVSA